jgi:hypothetical protein
MPIGAVTGDFALSPVSIMLTSTGRIRNPADTSGRLEEDLRLLDYIA